MQSGPVRRVARQDIRPVQDLIERCLQLYMTQKEVKEFLFVVAYIEPRFTELVWQTLEEENREFFLAYHLRLRLKQDIINFNKLLDLQVQLMHQNDELLSTYSSMGSAAVKPSTYPIHVDGPQPAMISTQSSSRGSIKVSNERMMKSEIRTQDTHSATEDIPFTTVKTSSQSQPLNEQAFLDAEITSGELSEIKSDTFYPIDPYLEILKKCFCGAFP